MSLVSLKFVGIQGGPLGWVHCCLGCWVVMLLFGCEEYGEGLVNEACSCV